jgi:hypothetical protein
MIQCHDNVWPNPALTPLPPLPQAAEAPPTGEMLPDGENLDQRTPPPTLGQGDDFEWLLLL